MMNCSNCEGGGRGIFHGALSAMSGRNCGKSRVMLIAGCVGRKSRLEKLQTLYGSSHLLFSCQYFTSERQDMCRQSHASVILLGII